MERKREMFFDGDKVNVQRVLTHLQQYSNYAESILDYVFKNIERFTEFKVKKEHLREKYEHKKQELYAEYMREDDEE